MLLRCRSTWSCFCPGSRVSNVCWITVADVGGTEAPILSFACSLSSFFSPPTLWGESCHSSQTRRQSWVISGSHGSRRVVQAFVSCSVALPGSKPTPEREAFCRGSETRRVSIPGGSWDWGCGTVCRRNNSRNLNVWIGSVGETVAGRLSHRALGVYTALLSYSPASSRTLPETLVLVTVH